MVFNVVQQEEGEDFYVITLSMRPEGDFEGQPGQEQFFIEKEGNVAHRQVLSLPRAKGGGFPKVPAVIGLVIVAVIAVVAAVILIPGEDEPPLGPSPATPPQTAPTDIPAPTITLARPTFTPVPTSAPSPTDTSTPVVGPRVDDHGNSIATASVVFEGRNRGVSITRTISTISGFPPAQESFSPLRWSWAHFPIL